MCLKCLPVLVGTVSVVWVLTTKLTGGQVVWNLKWFVGKAHATKFFGNASAVAWTLSTKMINTQRSSENPM